MGTLAGNYYGGIVKNGLVLMLDAAKKDSYDRLGTTWRDISWNGNNGTLTNFSSPSPQTVWDSNNGGSIIFDGTNDFVACGLAQSVGSDPTLPFSVSVWVKKNTSNGVYQVVIERYQGITISNRFGWYIALDMNNIGNYSVGDLSVLMNNSQVSASIITSTGSLILNQWINVVFTYDGTNGYLYVNGVLQDSKAKPIGTISANSRNINLGYLSIHNSQFLNANLSHILLYNRTLSSSEVLQNFNATKDRYLTTVPFEYFVLAGGGSAGGNGGGGGGAGGLLVGSNYVIENTTLTVTVGSGGGGVGSNSSLIGGVISVLSTGGGIGTTRDGNYGTTGGSGAGGAGWIQSNSAESGFAGISGQGSSGGNGTNYSLGGFSAGGGGGGYGSSGTNGSTQQGGNGGNGYLLSWNNTGYAGGGAGSGLDYNSFWGRAGTVQSGYGGGGPQNSSANGRVNSGGGGGSLANATNSGWSGGGAGGSGTVILKIGGNLKTTTGNPSIINNGSHYLYVFSGTGTITI